MHGIVIILVIKAKTRLYEVTFTYPSLSFITFKLHLLSPKVFQIRALVYFSLFTET